MKTLCTCAAFASSVFLLSSGWAAAHSGNDEPSDGRGAMIDQRNNDYDYDYGSGPGPGPGWQGFAVGGQDSPNLRRHNFWPWIEPSAMMPPTIAYQNLQQNHSIQQQPLSEAWPSGLIYRDSNGDYCREYQSRNIVNGVREQSHGTACQQQDGAWRIVR